MDPPPVRLPLPPPPPLTEEEGGDENDSIATPASERSVHSRYDEFMAVERSNGMVHDPYYSVYGNENDEESQPTGRKRRGGGDDDDDDKIAVSFDEIRSMSEKKRKKTNTYKHRVCWGCANALPFKEGGSRHPIVAQAYKRIQAHINTFLFGMQKETLVRTIKGIWDVDIAPYCKVGPEKRMPIFEVEEIYEHIFFHMKDPAVQLRVQIDDFSDLYTLLSDSVVDKVVEPDGRLQIIPNEKNLKAFVLIASTLNKLQGIDTSKSAAFNMDTTPAPPRKKSLGQSPT